MAGTMTTQIAHSQKTMDQTYHQVQTERLLDDNIQTDTDFNSKQVLLKLQGVLKEEEEITKTVLLTTYCYYRL